MALLWAGLLTLPAGWGIGLALSRLIASESGQLPAVVIPVAWLALLLAVFVPWAAAERRLRLMQALAFLSVLWMVIDAR